MEEILIKGIEKKKARSGKPFWVIKINGNRDATIGAWDEQLANFIENDVRVGGKCEVELKQKGDYLNIVGINMNDNYEVGLGAPVEKVENTPMKQSSKDVQITAAVLLKGAIEMGKGRNFENLQDEAQYMTECVSELYGVYKVALDVQK